MDRFARVSNEAKPGLNEQGPGLGPGFGGKLVTDSAGRRPMVGSWVRGLVHQPSGRQVRAQEPPLPRASIDFGGHDRPYGSWRRNLTGSGSGERANGRTDRVARPQCRDPPAAPCRGTLAPLAPSPDAPEPLPNRHAWILPGGIPIRALRRLARPPEPVLSFPSPRRRDARGHLRRPPGGAGGAVNPAPRSGVRGPDTWLRRRPFKPPGRRVGDSFL